MTSIWVLAEPETFLLPGLIDRLAQDGLVAGIVCLHFPTRPAARWRSIRRLMRALGWSGACIGALSAIVAKAREVLHPGASHSLSRVARKYGVPYYEFHRGFADPGLHRLLETVIGQQPVFVQVGRLVPADLVNRYVLLNKHCSLLPRYAGLYPVFWGLLHGETAFGVSVHRMNEAFDEGPLLAQASLEPMAHTVFGIYHELYDVTYALFARLLAHDGDWITRGQPLGIVGKSYYSSPTTADARLFRQRGLRWGIPLRLQTPDFLPAFTITYSVVEQGP